MAKEAIKNNRQNLKKLQDDFNTFGEQILTQVSGRHLTDLEISATQQKIENWIVQWNTAHIEKKNESEILKTRIWTVQMVWKYARHKSNFTALQVVRRNLRLLLRQMVGFEWACRVRFRLPAKRKLVVQMHNLIDLPFDLAWLILWRIRLSPPPQTGKRKNRSEDWVIVRLLVEMLFQGIKISDAIQLARVHWLPEKRMVFLAQGKGYRYAQVSDWLPCFLESSLYRIERKSTEVNHRKCLISLKTIHQKNWMRLVNDALQNALDDVLQISDQKPDSPASEDSLKGRVQVDAEKFRQAGLMYKLIGENLQPNLISSYHGPELRSCVIAPERLLDSRISTYKVRKRATMRGRKKFDTDAAVPSQKHSSSWEFVTRFRKQLGRYHEVLELRADLITREKVRAQTLKEMEIAFEESRDEKNKVSESWRQVLAWIIKIVGEEIKPNSALRYIYALEHVMSYCETHGRDMLLLDEENYREMLADEEGVIEYSRLDNIRTAVDSLYSHLRKEGMQLERIHWQRLQKNVVRTPRPIVLPVANEIQARILELLKGGERERDAAIAGILINYLGMRSADVSKAFLCDFRFIGEGEDYVEITEGKGSKMRRIRLSILPKTIWKILNQAWERALFKIKHETRTHLLQTFKTTRQLESLFDRFWKELMPSGVHSGRRWFATSRLYQGHDPIKIALILGHSSLRTLLFSYDLGVNADKANVTGGGSIPFHPPNWLSLNQMKNLSQVPHSTMELHYSRKGEKSLFRERISQGSYRKKGQVEWRAPVTTFLKKLEQRFVKKSGKIPETVRRQILCNNHGRNK